MARRDVCVTVWQLPDPCCCSFRVGSRARAHRALAWSGLSVHSVRARKAVQTRNWGSDYAVASKAGALPAWSRVPPVVAPGACGESDRSCHQGYSIEEVVIRVRKPALMLSRCLEATVRVFKHVVCACVRACACVRVPASRSCCKGPRGNKLSCRL